jgi:hypothetical protein
VTDVDTNDQGRPPVSTRPALKIFINYRHDDVPFAAAALYQQLELLV